MSQAPHGKTPGAPFSGGFCPASFALSASPLQ